jgi:hypothetical protein
MRTIEASNQLPDPIILHGIRIVVVPRPISKNLILDIFFLYAIP